MYKVLLVDDVPIILEGLRDLVAWEEFGLELEGCATTTEEALAIIRNGSIDVLITDIKMPEMSGLDLLRAVRSEGYDPRTIILSGYDEFDYAKEAAQLGIENYLLKPVDVDELSSTLHKIINKLENRATWERHWEEGLHVLQDNLLYRIVTDEIDEQERRENLDFLGIDIPDDYFIVSVMNLLERPDRMHSSMKELMQICDAHILDHAIGISFFRPDRMIITIMWGVSEESLYADVEDTLRQCVKQLSSRTRTRLFVTTGRVRHGMSSVSESYTEALSMQDYRYIVDPGTVLNFSAKNALDRYIRSSDTVDTDVVAELISRGHKNELLAYVDDVCARTAARAADGSDMVVESIKQLLFAMQAAVGGLKGTLAESLRASGVECIHPAAEKRPEELRALARDAVEDAIDAFQKRTSSLSPAVQQLLCLINDHYTKGISLKTIAYELGMNAAYLGRLFKQELGVMFTDYLNELRIRKAKPLLRETCMSAKAISNKIGYSDANYFYRIFSKMEGVTPKEYRLRHTIQIHKEAYGKKK